MNPKDLKEEEQGIKELEKETPELKRAERDMEIIRVAAESFNTAVGITDLEGNLIYVNDSCVKMWEYHAKEKMLRRFLPEFWEGDGIFWKVKELHRKVNP